MTLRARLALALAVVGAVILLSAFTLLALVRASLLEEVDHQLRAAASVAGNPALNQFRAFGYPPTPLPSTDNFEMYVGLVTADGHTITYLTPGTPERPPPLPAVDREAAMAHAVNWGEDPTPFDVGTMEGDEGYRMMSIRSPTGIVVVGLPTSRVDATFRRFELGMAAVGSVVLASLALATWWVERLGLRPIRHVTDAATAIAAGDLDRRVNATPAGTEAGDLARAFNVMVEQRQAWEQQLRRFVADASHELRTPLTTILGVMELHRGGSLPPGETFDDALQRAHLEARRMAALIEDLLLLAHLDQGRPLENEDVDLGELARDAAIDAGLAWPDRRVETEVSPLSTVVRGDAFRLRQVVTNLVANALTHAGEDARVRVVVRPATGDELEETGAPACVLEVSDDGTGMTAEQAAHVFDRFYRIDAARARRRGGSGLGLGLSIVRSIVTAHRGRVSLETSPGNGATIRVILPLDSPHFQATSSLLSPPVEADRARSEHGLPVGDGDSPRLAGSGSRA